MLLVITGGWYHPPFRAMYERLFLNRLVNAYVRDNPVDTLWHGDCRGADREAAQWAKDRGLVVRAWPAEWDRYGKKAGSLRNQAMVDGIHSQGDVELVVAFPGDVGTEDMIRRCVKAGHNVVRYAPGVVPPPYDDLLPF